MDLNGRIYVADIESRGLLDVLHSFDDLHVVSVGYKNSEGKWLIKSTRDKSDIQKFFGDSKNLIVMHNDFYTLRM